MDVERLLATLEQGGHDHRRVSGGTQILIVHEWCGDTKGHLYISAEHGGWICHHCQAHGNLSDLFVEVLGMKPFDAWGLAGDILFGDIQERRLAPEIRKPKTMQPIRLPDEFIRDTGSGLAGAYLERRGLDRKLCDRYGLGYCLGGDYGYRIIVPVYTGGTLRTFIARTWVDQKPKVLTAKGGRTTNALFNIDNVSPRACVLVEGVFDALKMPEVAIATLGTRSSQEQRQILRDRGFEDVVLMRDADEAGQKATNREALELAASFLHVYIAELPRGKDPADATMEELQKALDESRTFVLDYGQRRSEVQD